MTLCSFLTPVAPPSPSRWSTVSPNYRFRPKSATRYTSTPISFWPKKRYIYTDIVLGKKNAIQPFRFGQEARYIPIVLAEECYIPISFWLKKVRYIYPYRFGRKARYTPIVLAKKCYILISFWPKNAINPYRFGEQSDTPRSVWPKSAIYRYRFCQESATCYIVVYCISPSYIQHAP